MDKIIIGGVAHAVESIEYGVTWSYVLILEYLQGNEVRVHRHKLPTRWLKGSMKRTINKDGIKYKRAKV